jgi:hypothetical protein
MILPVNLPSMYWAAFLLTQCATPACRSCFSTQVILCCFNVVLLALSVMNWRKRRARSAVADAKEAEAAKAAAGTAGAAPAAQRSAGLKQRRTGGGAAAGLVPAGKGGAAAEGGVTLKAVAM